MRIALAGKGGAGKTTTAAALARSAARAGMAVLAVDADSNPNLAPALGVAGAPAPALPPALLSRRLEGPALTQPVEAVIAAHALEAPDGVRLVAMGAPAHAEQGCLCAAHGLVRGLLHDLADAPGWLTVVDMEASPEHLSRGTARHVDTLLLVTEPYYRSLEATRRLAELAAELPIPRLAVLANKVRTPDDAAAIGEFCARHGLDLVGSVPHDQGVIAADGRGMSLLDAPGAQCVKDAIAVLLDTLLEDGTRPRAGDDTCASAFQA